MQIVDKPWGFEQRFSVNQLTTVKMLYIKQNEMTSYQYHQSRDEEILVVKGLLKVCYQEEGEEKEVIMTEHSAPMLIPRRIPHRFIAADVGKIGVVWVLEISTGTYSEVDITRIDDKYGRGRNKDVNSAFVVEE